MRDLGLKLARTEILFFQQISDEDLSFKCVPQSGYTDCFLSVGKLLQRAEN